MPKIQCASLIPTALKAYQAFRNVLDYCSCMSTTPYLLHFCLPFVIANQCQFLQECTANFQYLKVKSRKENPQKLTQLSSRSHPRHLVGKKTAQKDTIIDITSDSQVNGNFPYRWSPASLTFNNYFTYFFIYNVNNHI